MFVFFNETATTEIYTRGEIARSIVGKDKSYGWILRHEHLSNELITVRATPDLSRVAL
jgi:hypothetical protein